MSSATGHVTWNTSHVTPGEYSIQFVVESAFSGVRVASEVLVRVASKNGNLPPKFASTVEFLPHDAVYVEVGQNVTVNLVVWDAKSVSGLFVVSMLPLPDGMGIWTTEHETSSNGMHDSSIVFHSLALSSPPLSLCLFLSLSIYQSISLFFFVRLFLYHSLSPRSLSLCHSFFMCFPPLFLTFSHFFN